MVFAVAPAVTMDDASSLSGLLCSHSHPSSRLFTATRLGRQAALLLRQPPQRITARAVLYTLAARMPSRMRRRCTASRHRSLARSPCWRRFLPPAAGAPLLQNSHPSPRSIIVLATAIALAIAIAGDALLLGTVISPALRARFLPQAAGAPLLQNSHPNPSSILIVACHGPSHIHSWCRTAARHRSLARSPCMRWILLQAAGARLLQNSHPSPSPALIGLTRGLRVHH